MKRLNEIEIHKLSVGLATTGERTFLKEGTLYYEGHVPHACYLLLKGEIVLSQKKKTKITVTAGHIVGFDDFSAQNESEYTATIKAGSSVFIIDKSTFFELKDSSDTVLKKIVS